MKPFDVIVVPFPFTDSAAVKRRPALVLSAQAFNDRAAHLVLAMITSRENRGWPLDVEIRDLSAAGLGHASIVRMKIFTLDERFVLRKAGSLAEPDRAGVQRSLRLLLPL
ncbi:MAG TPA: type II toxin-antitoxin system PemK/MazF family toxin [Opitutaceae bacterium]|nr:type II toxin-antitoxin system PemK/MazF family toxin [Opitutaceae bacterium]